MCVCICVCVRERDTKCGGGREWIAPTWAEWSITVLRPNGNGGGGWGLGQMDPPTSTAQKPNNSSDPARPACGYPDGS